MLLFATLGDPRFEEENLNNLERPMIGQTRAAVELALGPEVLEQVRSAAAGVKFDELMDIACSSLEQVQQAGLQA